MGKYFLLLWLFCTQMFLYAGDKNPVKQDYLLLNDPIDVVIVSHPKDKDTIDLCIDGIRKNCSNVGRVIVVSEIKLTDKGEWFNEKQYPFSKNDIAYEIGRGNLRTAQQFFKRSHPVGWYFQQLLKLYAPIVIPDISSNVLIIDADTIFLNPVEFLNESNGGLFCVSYMKAKTRYLLHAKRLVPGYKRVYPEYYSVCHHMLFQTPILEDLFNTVEKYQKMPFWKAFCRCVDLKGIGGASEYEIYYNYALTHTNQVELRPLKWMNSPDLDKIESFRKKGYHYVSFHTYMRRQ